MTWSGDNAEKVARCREAECPLVDANDERCGQCTGPVAWKDARGVRHGRARSCHGCPMDGLGLPVCWAACPGPNDGFQTDGQSMVSLGGMADADAFVGRFAADRPEAAGETFGGRERGFAAGLMRLDSRGWDALKEACGRMDAKAASAIMGVPIGMFRGSGGGWDGSVADRIMRRVGAIDGMTWERARSILSGRTQSDIARMGMVSKQAVSKAMREVARREDWLGRIVADSRADGIRLASSGGRGARADAAKGKTRRTQDEKTENQWRHDLPFVRHGV